MKAKNLKTLSIRKRKNLDLADKYAASGKVSGNHVKRVARCRDVTSFLELTGLKADTELLYAWNCGDRFCKACMETRTLAKASELQSCIDYVQANSKRKLRFLFMTLTVRNCYSDELKATIEHINESFDRMMRTKQFSLIKGYVRTLEVTRKSSDGTFHPHFHCILVVEYKDYTKTKFKKKNGKSERVENELYITIERLYTAWKKALRVDYNPSVDIRSIRKLNARNFESDLRKLSKDTNIRFSGITKEMSFSENKENRQSKVVGYVSKPQMGFDKMMSDIEDEINKQREIEDGWIHETAEEKVFRLQAEVLGVVYEALKGKRTIVYGGYFKEARKALKKQEKEDLRAEEEEYKKALESSEKSETVKAKITDYDFVGDMTTGEYKKKSTQNVEIHKDKFLRQWDITYLKRAKRKQYNSDFAGFKRKGDKE